MENAGIWMVEDPRRSAEYWALHWVGQLLNHPLLFDVQLSHWTFGADCSDWFDWTQDWLKTKAWSPARQQSVLPCYARSADRDKRVWHFGGLVAKDWIGLALVGEFVYTQCLWTIGQRLNCCTFLALLCRCRA